VNAKAIDGETPIFRAISRDEPAVVIALLKHGADMTIREPLMGLTPLHYAAVMDRVDIVWCLLQMGVDTQVRDRNGRTPLEVVSRIGGHISEDVLRDWEKLYGGYTETMRKQRNNQP
jgi:ankyrin repeat protein